MRSPVAGAESDEDKSSQGKSGKGGGPLADISGTPFLPYIKRAERWACRGWQGARVIIRGKASVAPLRCLSGEYTASIESLEELNKRHSRLYAP